MRFWTVQPRGIWDRMQRGETVRVDPDHAKYGGKRPWQYEWLSDALRRSVPGFDGGWPWWLSCDRPDVARLSTAKLPGGKDHAIIELELPDGRYARFPLWMWETIYTGRYLALDRDEFHSWQRELRAAVPDRNVWPLPEPWRSRLEESWQRLFDPRLDPRRWYHDEKPPDDDPDLEHLMRDSSDAMAGLTQVLRASDAVVVTPFTAAE